MVRRWLASLWVVGSLCLACAEENDGGFAGGGGKTSCVPGKQDPCACPGGLEGVQVCNADGKSFGACSGCGSGGGGGWPSGGAAGSVATGGTTSGGGGTTGGGGGATGGSGGTGATCPTNHCQNSTKDCDETAVDCGGADCTACPYVVADCVESPKNGSEICDDQGFQVTLPGSYLLVCLNNAGGTIYVASNTGPKMSDGIARCQGWETTGQNAWDHLSYLAKLVCDADQKQLAVNLTASVGQNLWIGAHDAPGGGGHNTQSCLVKK